MICDEDPLRRRPRESTARRKRQERCVWMARKMTEWPSKRGPITKIMPSDGCIGDTVPLAVGKWYDFHEFGWYMGNVGLRVLGRRLLPECVTLSIKGECPRTIDGCRQAVGTTCAVRNTSMNCDCAETHTSVLVHLTRNIDHKDRDSRALVMRDQRAKHVFHFRS